MSTVSVRIHLCAARKSQGSFAGREEVTRRFKVLSWEHFTVFTFHHQKSRNFALWHWNSTVFSCLLGGSEAQKHLTLTNMKLCKGGPGPYLISWISPSISIPRKSEYKHGSKTQKHQNQYISILAPCGDDAVKTWLQQLSKMLVCRLGQLATARRILARCGPRHVRLLWPAPWLSWAAGVWEDEREPGSTWRLDAVSFWTCILSTTWPLCQFCSCLLRRSKMAEP